MRHSDFAAASGFASRIFVPPPVPTITTTTVPNATVGTAYTTPLTASGGTLPYIWTVTAGTLPAGLAVVGQTIQGTPTTAGSSSFTLLVTDALAQTDVQAISLTVGAVLPPPQPTITTTSLAAGTVGTAYTGTLTASGGTPPYTWTVASGTLPNGLSLTQASGIITGTPTAAGNPTVGFQVTDTRAQQAAKNLTLTVTASGPNPLPQTIPFGSAPSTTNLGTETLQPGAESAPYPINWNQQGQYVTTPFSCPAGLTTFTIRYSAAVAASRQISLDGTVIFANLAFPATVNFQTWKTVSFTRTVTAGNHSMTMLFDVPSGSHDFINPDNLKLTAGVQSGTLFTIPPSVLSATVDSTAALQTWLATVPDGTANAPNTIQPVVGTRARIEGTVYFGSAKNPTVTPRKNLIFDMSGTEFFCTVPNPYGIEAASDITNDWFTYQAHGLDGTAPIQISNGLTNTTGIAVRTTYWPLIVSPDRFRLSTTQAGTALPLTGTADNQVNFRNAPSPNARAFLFSTDYPGNDNFDRIMFSAEGCQNIRFTDSAGGGQITGAQTNGTMGSYDPRYEAQAGISVFGGTTIEIDNIDIRTTLGDGIAVLGSTTYGQATFVNIHDNTITGTGRHGISVGNGGATDCTIQTNTIVGAPRHIIDLEDDNVGTTKPLRRITVSGNYCHLGNNPGPNNLNLWFAMGGESLDMGDIVVGGLLGHPLDGNLVVGGVMQDDVRNKTTALATTRRGPYTFGYNVGGGQITITTVPNSTTATFTGLTNNTRFTNLQLLQFQHLTATTLPNPCQINGMPTATTILLSHPATAAGTVTATFGSPFGKAPPSGAFDFLHIDGANSFFNTIVIQANPGTAAGSLYDGCTAINDHDNIVIGGPATTIVNPISNAGGTAAIRAAIGQGQDTGHYWTAQQNRWNIGYTPVGTVNPFRWNNTYAHVELSNPAGTTDSAGFGYVGGPQCLVRVNGTNILNNATSGDPNCLANIVGGTYDSWFTNSGKWMKALSDAQGGTVVYTRPLFEGVDGNWFDWGIGHYAANTVGAFNDAFNHACTKIQAGFTGAGGLTARLKFSLCSGGYGRGNGGTGFSATDFSRWNQVMDGITGHPGVASWISVSDIDAYSNGDLPTGPSGVAAFLTNWQAWATGRGLQVGHGEWGIGQLPQSQPNHNWSPAAWANLHIGFWAQLPAGMLRYICLFDGGQIDATVDWRGVSFVSGTFPGTSGVDGANVANTLKAGWQ